MRFIFTCVVLCCFGSSVYGGVSQIPVNFISEYVTLPLPTNNGALPVSQTSALQEGFVKGTTSYIAPLPVYEDPNQKVIQQTSYGPFHPSQELINVPVSPEVRVPILQYVTPDNNDIVEATPSLPKLPNYPIYLLIQQLPLLNRYPVNTISARQNIDNNVSVNRIQKKQVFFSEPVRSNLLYENSFQSYPSGQISQYY
ncbi:hypothetical protein ACFFRR_011770 [Megaselia abdita]